MRWCTSCSTLVQASAASCWVVESRIAAAVSLSLSARRDSERASRSRAVIAFAERGSGRSASSSVIHSVCCALQVPTAPEQRPGANLRTAIRLAERLGAGHWVVAVQVDSGMKYLGGDLYKT